MFIVLLKLMCVKVNDCYKSDEDNLKHKKA